MASKQLRVFFILLILGLALLLFVMQSENLWLDGEIGELGRLAYRAVFVIVLPFRMVVAMVIPRVDHHWPLAHYIFSSLGTPFFLYGLWWAGKKVLSMRRVEIPIQQFSQERMDRRQFITRTAASSFGVAAGGLWTYAALVEPERLAVRRYTLSIRDLPREFDGLRLVQISDTHLGPYVSAPSIEEALARANALNPDIVLLTGDYVHFTPKAVEPGIALLRALSGRLGVVGVLGNHDHWEGADACRSVFHRIGVPLIDNDRLYLTPDGLRSEPIAGHSICIAGVGDLWEDNVLFSNALRDAPARMPRIVLSHNPDTAELIQPSQRVDVMFSGHTHGGQVRIPVMGAPFAPSKYGEKYIGGLCEGPSCPVIVSRGIGLAGIPVRFRVPPEIVLTEFRQA